MVTVPGQAIMVDSGFGLKLPIFGQFQFLVSVMRFLGFEVFFK